MSYIWIYPYIYVCMDGWMPEKSYSRAVNRMQGHGHNYIERSNFPVHGLRFLGGDNFLSVLLVENRLFPAGCVGLPVHPWRKHLAFTHPDLPILPTDIYKV